MQKKSNMSAEGFLDHSTQFLHAARRLSSSSPFLFKPTFYCAIHAVELALKGHLVHQGFSAANLRRREFGHNIDRLLEQALADGAVDDGVIDYFDQQAIEWGSEDYASKCFEYPEHMYSTYPIGKWIEIAENLIGGLHVKLYPSN